MRKLPSSYTTVMSPKYNICYTTIIPFCYRTIIERDHTLIGTTYDYTYILYKKQKCRYNFKYYSQNIQILTDVFEILFSLYNFD